MESRQPKDESTHGVSWRDYMESRLDALEQARKLQVESLNHRLEGMNEIRESMRDQSALFATRSEMNLLTEKMKEDIGSLREFQAELRGKATTVQVHITFVMTVLSIVLACAALIVNATRLSP